MALRLCARRAAYLHRYGAAAAAASVGAVGHDVGFVGRVPKAGLHREHTSSVQRVASELSLARRSLFTASVARNVVPFNLSDIGEGIKEVTIKEWFVKVGDRVSQFDEICEVQSDKASVTITSRFDGTIAKLYYAVDDIAQTGDPLVDIEVAAGMETAGGGDNGPDGEVLEADAIQIGSGGAKGGGKALATPAVRRVAAQHSINIADVPGSGKDGRVLKEDIIRYVESGGQQQAAPAAPDTAPAPAAPAAPPRKRAEAPKSAPSPAPPLRRPPPAVIQKDTTEKFRPITRVMAKTMTAALQIPHFGYKDEIDMGALVRLRKQLKHQEGNKIKISYLPFMVKAASLSLLEHPILNASIDVASETITYRASHNIGVAMDTPDGLLVPSIKAVQNLTVLEVAEELNRLYELAMKGKLGESDLKDSTFSISNIGSIGGTYAFPVIAPPAVAIGAVGKIRQVPRFDHDDQLVKAHVMNVSWSADHRVIDGATMARFSNRWKAYLENPAAMLMVMR